MANEYNKDAFGNLSSTRRQSYQTHKFTLVLIAVCVVVFLAYAAVAIYKCGSVTLVDIPSNVGYVFLTLIVILLTYAAAPKAFAQHFEWKSFSSITNKKEANNEAN